MSVRWLIGVTALSLVATTGCTSAVPFVPDRELMRAIPREAAKDELTRLLALAWPANPVYTMSWESGPLEVLEVTDEYFAVIGLMPNTLTGGDPIECSFYYDRLELLAFRDAVFRGNVFISLEGAFTGGSSADALLSMGCIWFKEEEDAEKCLEALESLRTQAIASRGASAQSDAPSPGQLLKCSVCGHEVSSRAEACPNCGEPRK